MADGKGDIPASNVLAQSRANRTASPAMVIRRRVAVLTLDWPPPCGWSSRRIARFIQALERTSDGVATAIVLTGEHLFDQTSTSPSAPSRTAMDQILTAVARSPVPVIAAIPGRASGAGLELALACSARVARSGSIFALGDIASARLPRGATLRTLTYLVGIEAAADLIALARPWDADEAVTKGLVDGMADDPVAGAKALATRLEEILGGRTRALDALDIQARFFSVRGDLRRSTPNQVAPLSAARALEAAVQPRARQASAEVDQIADQLAGSVQGAALRYVQAGALALRDKAEAGGLDLAALATRLRWSLAREAVHLVDEGAFPAQVDRCLTAHGLAEGLFAASDRAGLAAIFTPVEGASPVDTDWALYSPTLDLMADRGRAGGDSPGWYQPTSQSEARFDPRVDQLLHAAALAQRLTRAPISDEAVLSRCLAAAINGGFNMLERQRGLSCDDVDALWVSRLGYPAWRGGPIYQARAAGLDRVVETITALRRCTIGPVSAYLAASAARGEDRPRLAKTA